jgi:uncharacterized protein YidB (DUF937 family)
MALMDDLIKQAGGVASIVAKNPQLLAAVASLLSTRDTSVGGSGGLGGLIGAFQKGGLGDVMSSWISTGPNPPITADQLGKVLGHDVLGQFAAKAGVPHAQAGGLLASLLPTIVDQLTPQGTVPETSALESALGGLLSGLGR